MVRCDGREAFRKRSDFFAKYGDSKPNPKFEPCDECGFWHVKPNSHGEGWARYNDRRVERAYRRDAVARVREQRE